VCPIGLIGAYGLAGSVSVRRVCSARILAFGGILRFRRYARRGQQASLSEWQLICSVHNLLKLRTAIG
jgi:hypothetical protein